jgi:hypothetical protein
MPSRRDVVWKALAGLSLMTLMGCPGMSAKDNERFQSLAASKVSPGMPGGG